MPQLPTLIPINHVPIVMHMGMMSIIASHLTQNYNKVNHKTSMLARGKVLGKSKGEKCDQQNIDHQADSKPTQHHGG